MDRYLWRVRLPVIVRLVFEGLDSPIPVRYMCQPTSPPTCICQTALPEETVAGPRLVGGRAMQTAMDGSPRAALRHMSNQNHLAAQKIQKVLRGHRKRLELWKYAGILYVAQVVKIQRCYRGFQGRLRAAEVYRQKILLCAHRIQGLYYRWHSRRLKLRAHLNFLNRGVVLLQSYFRMRAAIQFSNVIRRALHNKKAGMIQRQARRMFGLRAVQKRRRRFKCVYNHLLGQIRLAIQSGPSSTIDSYDVDSQSPDGPLLLLTVNTEAQEPVPDAEKHRPLTCREMQVEAFDFALSNLLAFGRYDVVHRVTAAMALAAHSESNGGIPTAGQGATLMICTGDTAGIDDSAGPQGCTGTATELAQTAAYLSLSASWTRAGKMRFTRADYMEEALGLMMQHSAVALARAQQQLQHLAREYQNGTRSIHESEHANSANVVPQFSRSGSYREQQCQNNQCDLVRPFDDSPTHTPPHEDSVPLPASHLPPWLLEMTEETVDLYYMTVLSMKGVASPYDSMILLADWVWFQACVHEHNAAGRDFVRVQAADMRARLREQQQRLEEQRRTEIQAMGTVRKGSVSFSRQGTGLRSIPESGSDLAPEPYVDPAYNEHEQWLQEGMRRRRIAVHRVYGLLHRARKLLSAESRDRREITDRLDLFHDLHMTEHRVVLVDARAQPFPFRAHYYSQQEAIERQRAASFAAVSAKVTRMQHGPAAGAADLAWSAEQTGSGELEADMQIILCGRTVLIKGNVPLHRLVEAADDLPPGSALPAGREQGNSRSWQPDKRASSKSRSRKGRSSKSHKSNGLASLVEGEDSAYPEEAPVQVAIRPFVLLRAEVRALIDLINGELGILDIVGSASAGAGGSGGGGGQDDASETNSVGSSAAGSFSQSDMRSHSQSSISVSEMSAGDQHKHRRRGYNHHGFTMAEFSRLADYIQRSLRLVSCQDAFVDPALSDTVRAMRATARQRLQHDKYMYNLIEPERVLPGGILPEAETIEPGVPNVRFSLPVVEYKRRVFNESQTVMHATQLLQRVYRGYQGRAKFRRMRWKRNEYMRQAQRTLAIRAEHDAVRFWRGQRLTEVQRLFRGYRWRKRLYALRCASLVVQCAFRMHRARRIVAAERRRRIEGAPVVPMLGQGRGVQVGDIKFTLKIYRSGTNYRLEGLDLLRGVVYEGAVYTPEVMRLIEEHNSGIKGTTVYANSQRIMPWQHDRVTELIISNLGMMPKITALTTQLGARTPVQPTQYILVTNKRASIKAPPVQPPRTAQQMYGAMSQSVLEVATVHTQKQRLQRYAQFREERKYRKQSM